MTGVFRREGSCLSADMAGVWAYLVRQADACKAHVGLGCRLRCTPPHRQRLCPAEAARPQTWVVLVGQVRLGYALACLVTTPSTDTRCVGLLQHHVSATKRTVRFGGGALRVHFRGARARPRGRRGGKTECAKGRGAETGRQAGAPSGHRRRMPGTRALPAALGSQPLVAQSRVLGGARNGS